MAGLLDYSIGTTLLHRLHPLIKIVLAISICAAAFVSANILFLTALLAFSVALGFLGKIHKKTLSLLSGLVKISLFLFALQLLFIRSGTTLFLFVTDDGIRTALIVVLRLMGATLPLALMLALTPMSDLSNALVRVVRLPYRYAFTVTTALRFIPVFTNEMGSIMEAQTARGVDFDTKNPFRKMRLMMPLCVPLLITSVGRTEQAAMAAEVRGFYLRTRLSGSKDQRFSLRDAGVLLVVIALIALAVLL